MAIPPIVLAAGVAPAFFAEFAALLVASALVAYLGHRLGVTPIVSFLVTGAIIGPHAFGLVEDEAVIEAAAEVGVVLLLFTIGIEFSLTKVARLGRLILIGGGLQVGLVLVVVTGLLLPFGVDWRTGVFTGCLVALSSTAIVMKLLVSRGEIDTEGGRTILAILIFQDLAVVAMVLLVPMLGGGNGSGAAFAWALGKAVVIVGLVLVVARRVMPRVLEAVARTCSQEIFGLSVMAICFGTAYLTSLAGVSLSLGAFLAGLVVSESRFSQLAFGEIQPLQTLFSATFFVSVGLLLDLDFVLTNLPLVLAIVAGVLLVKVLGTAVSVRALGYGSGTALFAGLMIGQVGEFSFVLERTGRELGLFPGGVEAGGPEAFIAATVLLMLSTPLLARRGEALRARLEIRSARQPAAVVETSEPAARAARADLDGHVIIAGYGGGGRMLARSLAEHGVPQIILTLSPEGASEAEQDGFRVLRGNYARRHELSLAGLERARLLVVADDDLGMTHRVVRAVRAMDAKVRVIARSRYQSEAASLHEAGVAEVVAEEQEGALRLIETVLRELGWEEETIRRQEEALRAEDRGAPLARSRAAASPSALRDRETLRLSDEQRASPRCSHAAMIGEARPRAQGCEECLRIGDRWIHLRVCMTCGHVGCCDSSRNKHATKHFHAAGHPIVMSFEPGESWAWCFEDATML